MTIGKLTARRIIDLPSLVCRFCRRIRISIFVVVLTFLLAGTFSHSARAEINESINFQGKLVESDGTNIADGSYYFKLTLYDAATGGSVQGTASEYKYSGTLNTVTDTSITYTGDTDEGTLQAGMVLWNTTDGDYAIIESVNTTTNTITLDRDVDTAPYGWTSTEGITTRVQVSDGIFNVKVVGLGSLDFNTDDLYIQVEFDDTPGGGDTLNETFSPRKRLNSVPYAFRAKYADVSLDNYWQRNGTIISPATGGDDLRLGTNEQLQFGSTGQITFEYSGTTLAVTQGNDDINFDGNTFFVDGSANRIGIGTNTPDYTLQVDGDVVSETDSTDNLGNSSIYWANSYIDRMYVNATAYIDGGTAGDLTITGDLMPSADDTYDLGSSTYRWQDLYLGPASLHIGTDGNEGVIGYDTATGFFDMDSSLNVNGSITGGSDAISRADNNFTFGYDKGYIGDKDFSFDTGEGYGINSNLYTTSIQSDGKVIIGGNFISYNGTARNRIARLNSDGSLDTNFNVGTGANGAVRTIAVQSDGKVIIGGDFTSYNGTARNYIARLNSDGSLDTSFNVGTGANNVVYTIAVQSDGKVIIGGNFTGYKGEPAQYLVRLLTYELDVSLINSIENSFLVGFGDNSLQVDSLGVAITGNLKMGVDGTQNYLYFADGSSDQYLSWDDNDFILSNDLLPSASNTYDLGSSSAYWANMYADTYYGKNTTISSFDLAEDYKAVDESITAGDVVVLADGSDISIDKSQERYQREVVGVISTKPGLKLSDWEASAEEQAAMRPVALAGRVPVKVTTENGNIEKGDLLVAASKPGYAMKACGEDYCEPGMVLGRALESFSTDEEGDSAEVSDELEEAQDETLEVAEEIAETIEVEENVEAGAEAVEEAVEIVETIEEVSENLTEPLPAAETEEGEGRIMMFVNLMWYDPEKDESSTLNESLAELQGLFAEFESSGWNLTGDLLATPMDVAASSFSVTSGTFSILRSEIITIGDNKFMVDSRGNVDLAGDFVIAGFISGRYGDLMVKLGDSEGENRFVIANSEDEEVFSVDSLGGMRIFDDENATTGFGIIEEGEKSVTIETTQIGDKPKVYITFNGDYYPATRFWVENIEEGESFDVVLNTETDEEVEFTWWIINSVEVSEEEDTQ